MRKINRSANEQDLDWRLTTWEGSRQEQMRRWAQLPLEHAIMALEEMEALANDLHRADDADSAKGET